MSSKKGPFIAKIILIAILYLLVVATVFQLLWNWLMPTIFGISTIHLGQSIGLLILGRLFFGKSARPNFSKLKKFGISSDTIEDDPNDAQREKWRNEWRKMCHKDDEDDKIL